MHIALIKSFTDKPWRSPATYNLIEKSLGEKWPVQSLATNDPGRLHDWIEALKTEYRQNLFVFNIAEFLDEKNKKGFLPALLDEWKAPHLGSGASTVTLGLDKHETKKHLLAAGIPTPRYFIARNLDASPHSFIPESIQSLYGISYSQLIQTLAENSMARQGFPISS